VVAVSARDVRGPQATRAIAAIERGALASGHFFGPATTRVSADHRVVVVELPMRGDGTNQASMRALGALRGTVVPAALRGTDGVRADVTGMTAGTADFNALMASRAPLVVLFVLTLAFLLLLVTFRSIVVPVKAIVLNLLSVAASYGVVVWIFQQGHLEGVLGYTSNGGVVSWLPIFLFVILFGLSMDYHVFILSRIREAVDRGRSNEDAVREGILATAGTVTSAAVVMVAVFGIFATLSSLDMKQMGVGLAVAIAIDSTLVRAVLLPAAMQLLGDRTWYLPAWLQWLPRVSWEGPASPAAEAEAAAEGVSAADRARARDARRRTPLLPRSASSPR
jgi:RND superfamily putative drug exporter